MIRIALALLSFEFSLLFALPARAAPELGIGPRDELLFGLVQTLTPEMGTEMGAELCLVGLKDPRNVPGARLRKSLPSGTGTLCERAFRDDFVESIRTFSKDDYKTSFWSGDPNLSLIPIQRTIDAELPGDEISAAYNRLKSRCAGFVCHDFKLVIWNVLPDGFAMGDTFGLPLRIDSTLQADTLTHDSPRNPKWFSVINTYRRLIRGPAH